MVDDVQRDGVDHVLHDDPEHGVGAAPAPARLALTRPRQRLGSLQRGLGRGSGVTVGLETERS